MSDSLGERVPEYKGEFGGRSAPFRDLPPRRRLFLLYTVFPCLYSTSPTVQRP